MRVETSVQSVPEEPPLRSEAIGRRLRLDAVLPEWRVTGPLIAVAVATMWMLVTEGRPWNLFATGAFSSDFYDAQAEAFLDGRLDVDPDVAQLEGVDIGGRSYLYYGVFLSVVRLPVALVTDSMAGQLARCSILVAYAFALFAAAHLARSIGRVLDPGAPDGRYRIGLLVAAVAASPALFAGGWVTVYHETEIWAFAFALVALAAAARLLAEPSMGAAMVAAVAASLCTLTRASVGVGATAAVLVVLAVVYWQRWSLLVRPAIVAVAGGLVHAWVNWARFGDPVSVPVDRQLLNQFDQRRADWLADHGGSIFSGEFIPTTLLHYLRPDAIRFERLIPFVRYGPPADELAGVEFESNTPATSLTVGATLLCVLAVIGLIRLVRSRRWVPIALAVAMAVGTVPTFAIGFIANRYLIDLLAPLVMLAACGVWLFDTRRYGLRSVLAVLAAWGVLVNVSLALWTGHGVSAGFVRARYEVDRLFPEPAPAVMDMPVDYDDVRFGTVAIDRTDGCKAVYVAGPDAWMALERAEGYGEVTGTVAAGSATVLVDTGEWSVTVERSGDVVYRGATSELTVTSVDEPAGDEVGYRVAVDPASNDRFVSIGSGFGFLPTEVLTSPRLDQSDGADVSALCELLADRLG